MQMALPEYELPTRVLTSAGSFFEVAHPEEVFDVFRRRWVRLTPEERVRQTLLRWLVDNCGVPAGRVAVEQSIMVNGTKKRCDAVIYDTGMRPLVIVECKAPEVRLTQKAFDQAAVYNSVLGVPYLLLSNGTTHFFCKVDIAERRYMQFDNFPQYGDLL